jgi:rubrerythrin
MVQDDARKSILAMIRVLDKGIAMEHNARGFYLESARACKSRLGKRMLRWLASFEVGHEARLKAKRDELLMHSAMSGVDVETLGRYTVSEASDSRKLPDQASETEILKMAIENEKRAYSFFRRKITLTADPSIEALFAGMALEEERHIKILRDQLDHYKINQLWKDFEEFEEGQKVSNEMPDKVKGID